MPITRPRGYQALRAGERRKAARLRQRLFRREIPLAKLDLIAVPGGFGGAMENWGGIVT